MIYLYSGTPGSGKSLHAAQTIVKALKRRKTVVANFEVNLGIPSLRRKSPDFRYFSNDELSVEALVNISRSIFQGAAPVEGRILLVIDEAQLILNPMQWQSTFAKGWLTFFTQHRKFGYDVILIAQFDRMINRQVRSLIEYEYTHRKVSNMGGVWGLILPLFMGRFYEIEGWYPVKMRTGGHSVRYGREAFQLYDTFKSWG